MLTPSCFDTAEIPSGVTIIGDILGIIGERNDSSPSKAIENSLSSRAELFETLTQAVGVFVVVIKKPDETIVYASPESGGLFFNGTKFSGEEQKLVSFNEELNPQSGLYFLVSRVNVPFFQGLYKQVHRLPGGFAVVVTNTATRYVFPFTPLPGGAHTRYEGFIDTWKKVLSIYGDRPVALSGGVDSAFICALMKELNILSRVFHYSRGDHQQAVAEKVSSYFGVPLSVRDTYTDQRSVVERSYQSMTATYNIFGSGNWNHLQQSVSFHNFKSVYLGETMDSLYMVHNKASSENTMEENRRGAHSIGFVQNDFIKNVPDFRRFLLSIMQSRVKSKSVAPFMYLNTDDALLEPDEKLFFLDYIEAQFAIIRESLIEEVDAAWFVRAVNFVRYSSAQSTRLRAQGAVTDVEFLQPALSGPLLKQYLSMHLEWDDCLMPKRFQYEYLDLLGIPFREFVEESRSSVKPRKLRNVLKRPGRFLGILFRYLNWKTPARLDQRLENWSIVSRYLAKRELSGLEGPTLKYIERVIAKVQSGDLGAMERFEVENLIHYLIYTSSARKDCTVLRHSNLEL